MVLSAVQQVVVSVVLVLCVFVVMPRMFGGGGGGGGGRAGRSPRGGKAGPGHYDPRQHRRGRSRGGGRGRGGVVRSLRQLLGAGPSLGGLQGPPPPASERAGARPGGAGRCTRAVRDKGRVGRLRAGACALTASP